MHTRFATGLLAALALFTAIPAALDAQTSGACPNQRASFVPLARGEVPPWRTCYLRVHVLGVWVSLGNGRCPAGRTRVAAHSECLGAGGEGTTCEDIGTVPIEFEQCRCRPGAGHSSWISSCQCDELGTIGFVTAGATIPCH